MPLDTVPLDTKHMSLDHIARGVSEHLLLISPLASVTGYSLQTSTCPWTTLCKAMS